MLKKKKYFYEACLKERLPCSVEENSCFLFKKIGKFSEQNRSQQTVSDLILSFK